MALAVALHHRTGLDSASKSSSSSAASPSAPPSAPATNRAARTAWRQTSASRNSMLARRRGADAPRKHQAFKDPVMLAADASGRRAELFMIDPGPGGHREPSPPHRSGRTPSQIPEDATRPFSTGSSRRSCRERGAGCGSKVPAWRLSAGARSTGLHRPGSADSPARFQRGAGQFRSGQAVAVVAVHLAEPRALLPVLPGLADLLVRAAHEVPPQHTSSRHLCR